MAGVDVVIQAHPLRAQLAKDLAARVGARICFDPAPEDPVKSPWRTYRHCIETAAPDASHLIVIQDDATACDGFMPAARAAIAARPDRVIVFCVTDAPPWNRIAIQKALERGSPWAELKYADFLPVIAVAWPASLARELVAWVDKQDYPPASSSFCSSLASWFADDAAMAGRFLLDRGIVPLATVPSLVDHDDITQSLHCLASGAPARRTLLYISRDCDAASIDYAVEVNPPPPVPTPPTLPASQFAGSSSSGAFSYWNPFTAEEYATWRGCSLVEATAEIADAVALGIFVDAGVRS